MVLIAHNTPVLTLEGVKLAEELVVGDEILAACSNFNRVLAVTSKKDLPAMRLDIGSTDRKLVVPAASHVTCLKYEERLFDDGHPTISYQRKQACDLQEKDILCPIDRDSPEDLYLSNSCIQNRVLSQGTPDEINDYHLWSRQCLETLYVMTRQMRGEMTGHLRSVFNVIATVNGLNSGIGVTYCNSTHAVIKGVTEVLTDVVELELESPADGVAIAYAQLR